MNGSSALNYPTNEQLIGKFHVTNVDKIPMNNHPEEIIPQTVTIPDESGCASRFQMIRVDRNFGNGRWKVHDYEPPENTSISTIPLVNTIENESINVCNDPNITTSAATAFQQQRMSLNSTPAVVPTAANVPPPPPTGFLHGYAPNALTNQSYLLSNHPPHPQFGYYHFYPPPYSHYAPPWATPAALAAANPYLQPPTTSLLSSTANHNDPLRLSDIDNNGENAYPNPTIDPLQNAQFAAYLYALQHSHSQYIPQTSSTAPSYATIPSYHPLPPPHPTILPLHNLPNSTTDIQQSHQPSILTSPKHEGPKSLLQQSSLITPKTKPSVTTVSNGISNDSTKSIDIHDLISSSPALTTAPPTLISPINISTTNVPTTSLNNIWSYTTAGSPLNLIQTTQTAAVTEMNLLNNEPSQNTEIAHDILKELTTPTKQNNTTDIDNKISAAMDLVKMHLLSAVREEVTELRQQIRILNEKLNSLEHENAFLRPNVPSEIYAQYIPPIVALSSSNDSTNSTTNTVTSISSVSSSQPVPMTSLSTIPSVLAQQTTLSTNQPPSSLSTTNLPLT